MYGVPRGILLNNPGNIRISSAHWVGKVIPSRDPDFEQFATMEDGLRAIAKIFIINFTDYRQLRASLTAGRPAVTTTQLPDMLNLPLMPAA